MELNDKTVYYFITSANIPFVLTDIEQFARNCHKLVIVTDQVQNFLPAQPNISVKKITYDHYSTLRVFFANPLLILFLAAREILKTSEYIFHPRFARSMFSNLLRSFYLKEEISRMAGPDAPGSIFYTFWFNNWATALSALAKEKKIQGYFSRAHGTDLYEERVPVLKRIAFRDFQLKYASGIFSVSATGSTYLKKKYPQYAQKIHAVFLGTKFEGKNPFKNTAEFTIVSCANVRNIKRIHLIPLILEQLNFPVKWIHIGDENGHPEDNTIAEYMANRENLRNRRPDITLISTGKLTNAEVFELYSSTSINLFLSVSETEGLPVSMMEALSFGIPVMATDVGGCSEIVNEHTGFLVPKDFDPKEVAQKITEFKNSAKNSGHFRDTVVSFWQKHFDINTNFKEFCSKINSPAPKT